MCLKIVIQNFQIGKCGNKDPYRRYSKDSKAIIHRIPKQSGDGFVYVDDYLEVIKNADYNLSYNKKEYIVEVYESYNGSKIYTPQKLIELYEIPVSIIDNNKLSISISDTSILNEYLKQDLNAGVAVRFDNKNGDQKTIIVGNNLVNHGHAKDFRPESSRLKKNVEVDYISGEISSTSNINMLIDEEVNSANTRNLTVIFIVLIVITLIELIILKLLNKTKIIKWLMIINVIISIIVISFYLMVFNSIVNIIS